MELSNLVIQKPETVAPERSEGATKGLRVTKSLRLRHLTYLDYTEQKSHDNAIISVEELVIDFLSEELLKFPWYPLGN